MCECKWFLYHFVNMMALPIGIFLGWSLEYWRREQQTQKDKDENR